MARQSILPKSIAALKADPRVDEVSVERDEFGGFHSPFSYWAYLKPGWINARDEVHSVHESTVREFLEGWRHVKPCDCDDCKKGTR